MVLVPLYRFDDLKNNAFFCAADFNEQCRNGTRNSDATSEGREVIYLSRYNYQLFGITELL